MKRGSDLRSKRFRDEGGTGRGGNRGGRGEGFKSPTKRSPGRGGGRANPCRGGNFSTQGNHARRSRVPPPVGPKKRVAHMTRRGGEAVKSEKERKKKPRAVLREKALHDAAKLLKERGEKSKKAFHQTREIEKKALKKYPQKQKKAYCSVKLGSLGSEEKEKWNYKPGRTRGGKGKKKVKRVKTPKSQGRNKTWEKTVKESGGTGEEKKRHKQLSVVCKPLTRALSSQANVWQYRKEIGEK